MNLSSLDLLLLHRSLEAAGVPIFGVSDGTPPVPSYRPEATTDQQTTGNNTCATWDKSTTAQASRLDQEQRRLAKLALTDLDTLPRELRCVVRDIINYVQTLAGKYNALQAEWKLAHPTTATTTMPTYTWPQILTQFQQQIDAETNPSA